MDNINFPLVSIISPCFNGEKLVHRFLDSILYQTYNNIELIFVNDGSIDQTEEIVLSYQEQLKERGIQFIYIYQENAGQAAALNQGLKVFKGSYLKWIDSDDILVPNAIEKKVNFLEKNKQYGFCMCKTRFVLESNINHEVRALQRCASSNDNLFHDLITESNVVYCGPYMFRASAYLEINKERRIYESRAGQNWQMLLPMAYNFKCGYMEDILFICVIRSNSHSRQEKDTMGLINKTYQHQDILTVVIKDMHIPEEKEYLKIIQEKYSRKRLRFSLDENNSELAEKEFALLREIKCQYFTDVIYYLGSRTYFVGAILKQMKNIRGKLHK